MQTAILKFLIELAEIVLSILLGRLLRHALREGSFQIKHKLMIPAY